MNRKETNRINEQKSDSSDSLCRSSPPSLSSSCTPSLFLFPAIALPFSCCSPLFSLLVCVSPRLVCLWFWFYCFFIRSFFLSCRGISSVCQYAWDFAHPGRAMREPDRCQVLGGRVWGARDRSHRNVSRSLRSSARARECVLQWGQRWEICPPCSAHGSGARYHG